MKPVFVFLCCLFTVCADAQDIQLYVSPNAKGGNGSLQKPFSLQAAQAKVRSLNKSMTGDIVVNLRGGIYSLSTTFTLTEEDGGSNNFSVVYKAYADEKTVFSGGKKLSGFIHHEKGIYKTSVGSARFRQLYAAGQRLTLARTPNKGEEHKLLYWDNEKREIGLEGGSVGAWKNFSQVEMVMQLQWSDARMRLQSVRQAVDAKGWLPGNHQLLTVQDPEREIVFKRNFPTRENGQAYHFENAYEFIDEPGEWYLDRTNGTLYLKPPAGADGLTMEAMAPSLDTLVKLTGKPDAPLHHLRLDGIAFQYSNWTYPDRGGHVHTQAGQWALLPKSSDYNGHPPAAVYAEHLHHVQFHRNRFEYLGATALELHFGAQDNSITGNVFRDVAGNGISIGRYWGPAIEKGFYKDPREACLRDTVANNLISHIGADYAGSVAVSCGYVAEAEIAHNEIHDVPYHGISVGWGWSKNENMMKANRIHHNHLYRVVQVVEDAAAIYTLSAQPGSEIFGNYIHSITPSPYVRRMIVRGIYLDEGSAGITVGNNAIEKSPVDERGLQMTEEIGFHRVHGVVVKDDCCQGYNGDVKRAAGLQKEYAGIMYR